MNEFYRNLDSVPTFTGNFPPENIRRDYISLIQAIRSGNEALVQHMVDNGAPVNRLFNFRTLTPLHLAVQSRSLKIVEILVDKDADVNAKSWNGDTPLILAAKTGDFSLVDSLLAGDICNCADQNSFSHLHIVSMRNRVDLVKKLLSTNQVNDLNTPVRDQSVFWRGYTPLHLAAHFGCTETIEYLLKCGADMMAKNSGGLTPLHLADLQRNEKIIDLLLSYHKYEVKNPFSMIGLSHFHIACTRDDISVVEHFLKLGVDINLPAGGYVDGPWNDWRPVHFAIYYGCSKVIQFLKRAGALLLHSPIDTFLKYEFMVGNEFMYELLTKRIEFDEIIIERHEKLKSFVKALIHEDLDTTRVVRDSLRDLVDDASINLNEPIWAGGTVLHLAVRCQSGFTSEILMNHGAKVLISDYENQTPLHIAFYRRHRKILNSIVEALSYEIVLSMDQNWLSAFVDNDGLSIFHILCTTNNLQAIEKCLCNDMDVNAQVYAESELWAGFTALHFACMYHQVDVVKLLLKNHADILITNKVNLNPFQLTVEGMVSDASFKHDSYFSVFETILQKLPSRTESFNTYGASLLHVLCFKNKNEPEDLDLLRQYLIDHQDEIKQTIELNYKHVYNKCTPLHLAMMFGNWEKAQLMLEHGANPLAVNSDGRTPLECAFRKELRMSDWAERISTFFTFETVNQTFKPSHFHMACAAGLLDIVTRVLETSDEGTKKTFVNFRDDSGRTALHSLLQKSGSLPSCKHITRLLLANSADVNARDYKLRTPLYLACHYGDADVVKFLIDHGADVNSQDVYGSFLVCNIFISQSVEKIAALLDNGIDINLINVRGETCLETMYCKLPYMAVLNRENGYRGPECIVLLLKHVKKLELIGSNVSEDNRVAYAELLPYVDDFFAEASFINECERELESMEPLNISRHTTLRDILSKSLNEMAFYCENVDLQQAVESDDFLRRFPIYGYLVKLQIKNGAARRSLLIKSQKSLVSLIGTFLPQVCIEMILSEMSETDLRNITLSAQKSKVVRDE